MATSDEELEWIWSYREQLAWFDKCDAAWIEQAHRGWDDRKERKEFLKAYSLGRGPSGKFLLNHTDDVFDALDPIYREAVSEGDVDKISQQWHNALDRVQELSRKKGQSANGVRCPSFTLKLYWFYQPHALTMYDTNALETLKKEMGERSISDKNFLELFEKCYCRHKDHIEKLGAECCRKYPYPRRTLDFWLWSRGSKNRELTLKRFRTSVEAERTPA